VLRPADPVPWAPAAATNEANIAPSTMPTVIGVRSNEQQVSSTHIEYG
jgi:hypothetical protein